MLELSQKRLNNMYSFSYFPTRHTTFIEFTQLTCSYEILESTRASCKRSLQVKCTLDFQDSSRTVTLSKNFCVAFSKYKINKHRLRSARATGYFNPFQSNVTFLYLLKTFVVIYCQRKTPKNLQRKGSCCPKI